MGQVGMFFIGIYELKEFACVNYIFELENPSFFFTDTQAQQKTIQIILKCMTQ